MSLTGQPLHQSMGLLRQPPSGIRNNLSALVPRPTIGALTLREIKPGHIFDLLKLIWNEKRETANKARDRIETIIAKNDVADEVELLSTVETKMAAARAHARWLRR